MLWAQETVVLELEVRIKESAKIESARGRGPAPGGARGGSSRQRGIEAAGSAGGPARRSSRGGHFRPPNKTSTNQAITKEQSMARR
jgi:hypothetical protein